MLRAKSKYKRTLKAKVRRPEVTQKQQSWHGVLGECADQFRCFQNTAGCMRRCALGQNSCPPPSHLVERQVNRSTLNDSTVHWPPAETNLFSERVPQT